MSVISNLIFHDAKHNLTSPFGPRKVLNTSGGKTSAHHDGADYGTNGIKRKQYAIEEGKVLQAGTASDGANYVWLEYPRLGVKMLHYHLDAIKVKTGQKVNADTVIGTTGKTGKATGIHLHLGIKRLSGGGYIDPEAWSENEYKALVKEEKPKVAVKSEEPKAAATVKAREKKEAKFKPQSFDAALAGNYKVTADNGLNIRNGAGKSKAKMVVIPKGKKVRCHGYYTTQAKVKWLYVEFTHNEVDYIGFASSEYFKEA